MADVLVLVELILDLVLLFFELLIFLAHPKLVLPLYRMFLISFSCWVVLVGLLLYLYFFSFSMS